ncbi:MAG TPA: fumarylacetoacetase [Gemmatimonadaceae bacterium]|jgi:fumarylacetoacetase|nr:fumarylacetoacetase [Gemmatimonadaceae bacterium]
MIDATHDPALVSWVESANDPATDFPIQNLPFGVFLSQLGAIGMARTGVAIGDKVLDIAAALRQGLIEGEAVPAARACGQTLNDLMALGTQAWRALRQRLSELLRANTALGERASKLANSILWAQREVVMQLPASIGNYSDFYASLAHATNVGSMMRPDNPLLPNYKWVPIGYHGRASSIVLSGTPVKRPQGQTKADDSPAPRFGPSARLDYELELGLFVGPGNQLGSPIPIAEAGAHLFGLCLLNDWSARDIQAWEYQPLGPFLSKSFATSISPWIVTTAALSPFRTPAPSRVPGDPQPLPYLSDESDHSRGAFDIGLEVYLQSRTMRDRGLAPQRLSRVSFAGMYWTAAQLIAHHSSNGCNLLPGDVLGSGTVSGDAKDSRGCLLELTWRGGEPIALASGEARRFLEDGDIVTLRGSCERQGYRRIGFGECSGEVIATVP